MKTTKLLLPCLLAITVGSVAMEQDFEETFTPSKRERPEISFDSQEIRPKKRAKTIDLVETVKLEIKKEIQDKITEKGFEEQLDEYRTDYNKLKKLSKQTKRVLGKRYQQSKMRLKYEK